MRTLQVRIECRLNDFLLVNFKLTVHMISVEQLFFSFWKLMQYIQGFKNNEKIKNVLFCFFFAKVEVT